MLFVSLEVVGLMHSVDMMQASYGALVERRPWSSTEEVKGYVLLWMDSHYYCSVYLRAMEP